MDRLGQQTRLIVYCQHGDKETCRDKHLRKANKEHLCWYCKAVIEKGDLYYGLLATMGIGKGKVFNMLSDYVCLICAEKHSLIERQQNITS